MKKAKKKMSTNKQLKEITKKINYLEGVIRYQHSWLIVLTMVAIVSFVFTWVVLHNTGC